MFKKISVLIFFLLLADVGFGQEAAKDSIYIDGLFQLGDSIEYEEPQRALQLYKEAYELSRAEKYDNRVFKAVLYTALVHSNMGRYDSAFYYYEKSEKLAAITKNPLNKVKIAINRANAYHLTGNDNKAVENHLEGISYLESIRDSTRLADAYANLAAVYDQLKNNQQLIFYLKKAILIAPNEATGSKALSYGDLAVAYLKVDSLDLAKSNLIKSDSLSRIGNNLQILPFFIDSNWGEYYRTKKEHVKAIGYYKKSLKTALNLNYRHFATDILLYLGQSYEGIGDSKSAEKSYLEAIDLGKELGFVVIQQRAHGYLSSLYNNRGQVQKAYDNLKLFDTLKDSLNLGEQAKQINQLETRFQSEKKDKEIAEQKLAIADQELAITQSKSKTRTMSILIVSLLLASILLWFLFQQRQKRIQQQLVTIQREHEVRTLESLMEGEEKERFRIAKELHDGVNGDLSAIKFKLSSLLEMNNTVIKEAVAMIDNSCEQVRAISHNLVPPSLKNFSLLEAVDEYCQSMNSIHDPEVHFQNVGDPIHLDKKKEANLFRIVQELVTNSIKHAEAKEINVQLSHLENTLQLTVEDNGKGFDPKTVKSDGIGMQNVQSRVDYLNATMDFVSNEKGTSYTIAMNTKTV